MSAQQRRTDTESGATAPDVDWLVGGGAMARLIKSKDWSQTPLGPIESWPQSLRTVLSLQQASNAPISLIWNMEHHIQIYNDGYWPICGDKHPTSMGQDFRECWASAFPVIGEAYASACAGKTAYLEKMRMFLDRYGFMEETWFTFSFSPITDESGKVGGLFHPVTELTSQMLSERRTRTLRDLAAGTSKAKTTHEAFHLSEQVLAAAELDVPFALVYLLDDSGHRATLVAHTGMEPGTPHSPRHLELREPDDSPWPIAAVVRSGQALAIDDVAARLAGMTVGPYPELPRQAFALPIMLPGRARPAAVMIAGVSARLIVNEPYRGFYDLMAAAISTALANARAHEEEHRRAEALAELDRAKTAFFSNVSHEFRTPLTLMLGPLEDELNEPDQLLPAARRERIAAAHRNSLRLLRLVNSLLDFSRIEAGRVQAAYEPTNLAALTIDLASSFRSATERAGLTLEVDCPPLPQDIYVDREMWEKILLNLLSNAFKHTFHGGIVVRLRWLGDGAELSVQDSGIGIAAHELPKLFQRFQRVRGAAARTHEGTGIGLSLVQELVKLHQGSVRAESEEGKGSRFIVTLPAGSAHLPAERVGSGRSASSVGRNAAAFVQEALHWLPQAEDKSALDVMVDADPGEAPATDGRRPRVLWADDNADMRNYVAGLLGRAYQVHAVVDGEAALQAALSEPPDLILSDVMMPRLDGFGLLRALRADERTHLVPVILISARAGEESALEGLEAGADDYLVKPFSAKELLARVRSCLSLSVLRKQSSAKLTEANRTLADAAAAKASFLASMSHEIRTPMNAIIGMTGLLLDTALDSQQHEFTETIRKSGEHLLAIINDILDYSKIEAGKMGLDHAPFDPRACIEEALDLVAIQAHSKNLELAYEARIEPGCRLMGDVSRLRQVIVNLLSNAVKFTAAGEVVVVLSQPGGTRSEAEPRELEIAVRDTGIGMTAEQKTRLFQAFSQADTSTTRKYGGTGLGLAISKRLVEAMGGVLSVESEPGRGSVFRFTFRAPAAPPPDQAQPELALRGKRVLVVDDNATNRKILRTQVESWGMEVWDSESPRQALEQLTHDSSFELALLDFQMPEMDGMTLAQKMRQLPSAQHLAIAIFSSGGVSGREPEVAQGIVQGILRKPIRLSQLHDILMNLLAGRPKLRAAREQPSSGVALPSLRILLVEDNPVNQRLAQLLLHKLGQRPDVASNGLEALDAVKRQPYDVVLMDCEMPEMDGFAASRAIRATMPRDAQPRIIALTANAVEGDRERCLDAGMDDYVTKPVRKDELAAALARAAHSGVR